MDKDKQDPEKLKPRYPRFDPSEKRGEAYDPTKIAEIDYKTEPPASTPTAPPPELKKHDKLLEHKQTLITSEGIHKKKKYKIPGKLVKLTIAVIIVLILFFGVTALVSRN